MIKKIIFFVAIASLLAGVWAWMDFTHKRDNGYCFAENKYLSENDLRDAALQALYTRLKNEYEAFPPETQSKLIFYNSLEELKLSNPDCCNKNFSPDFWNRADMRPYWADKGIGFFFSTQFRIYLDKATNIVEENSRSGSTVSVQIYACGDVRSLRISNDNFNSRRGVFDDR